MLAIELLHPVDAMRAAELALGASEWEAGDVTARRRAAAVKQNKQLRSGEAHSTITADIAVRLSRSPRVQHHACPHHIMGVMVNRYDEGDRYGPHVDSHQIQGHRADLSFTVLLHASERGGDLKIGNRLHELEPGEAVVYPTTEVHEVTPVLEGYRIAVCGWIESWIPDAGRRLELERLATVRARLEELAAGLASGANIDRRACAEELDGHALELGRHFHNLHRRWGR